MAWLVVPLGLAVKEMRVGVITVPLGRRENARSVKPAMLAMVVVDVSSWL